MANFDNERLLGIATELQSTQSRHAALFPRTEDPQFRRLLELSRKWWVEWYAAGLHDIARDEEQDALELEFCDRLAVLETAMVNCAGVAGCKRFLAWAQTEDPDYVPPMFEGCSAWEEAEARA